MKMEENPSSKSLVMSVVNKRQSFLRVDFINGFYGPRLILLMKKTLITAISISYQTSKNAHLRYKYSINIEIGLIKCAYFCFFS